MAGAVRELWARGVDAAVAALTVHYESGRGKWGTLEPVPLCGAESRRMSCVTGQVTCPECRSRAGLGEL